MNTQIRTRRNNSLYRTETIVLHNNLSDLPKIEWPVVGNDLFRQRQACIKVLCLCVSNYSRWHDIDIVVSPSEARYNRVKFSKPLRIRYRF